MAKMVGGAVKDGVMEALKTSGTAPENFARMLGKDGGLSGTIESLTKGLDTLNEAFKRIDVTVKTKNGEDPNKMSPTKQPETAKSK